METRGSALATERCSFIDSPDYDFRPPSRFLIHQAGCFRIYWDIFVILLCIYNSISIPLSVGFDVVGTR